MRFHSGLRKVMQFLAPAKINLSLKILGPRADGFHEIDTAIVPVSLADELVIEPNDSGSGLSFSVDDPSLPVGEENLVVRAARRFFAEVGGEASVRIRLRKKIPHGAGLGGGSSDAATTLLGLNQLQGGPVPFVRLTTIAAEIGSDVPFFLKQTAARCRGRGEIVVALQETPQLELVLVKPEFGVATPWAYRQWRDSRALPGIDYAPQSFEGFLLENDLERPVFEKHLFLAQAKTWLRAQPEVAGALLSGSGSTMFAVVRPGYAGAELADRVKNELDPMLWTCCCRTGATGVIQPTSHL
jgi:4-diphosphocytidyl-2-C-methyl-D-erythritol kinase